MSRITACMSVCGHEDYFRFASISIPSFCKSNPNCKLLVFTDNQDKIVSLTSRFKQVSLHNFQSLLPKIRDQAQNIMNKTDVSMEKVENYNTRTHVHKYVSLLLLMAQEIASTDYILKVDCDAYFVGNMIPEIEREIEDQYDLYLVRRDHIKMFHLRGGHGMRYWPGVGFTLWKRQSKFIHSYVKNFYIDEQRTIVAKLCGDKMVNTKIIDNPGFHFVYPFRRAKRLGQPFTKADADEFTGRGAYFHLGGSEVYENLQRMQNWYELRDSKLWACLAFYNDGIKSLKRCLESLKKNGIDKIIAIDGAYKDFPLNKNETPQSFPDQVELVKKYADIFVEGKLWENQVEKRNAYLDFVPDNDFFFVIDGDEGLANRINKSMMHSIEAWNVDTTTPNIPNSSKISHNKVFRKFRDLRYVHKHSAIYRTSRMRDGDLYVGIVSRRIDLPFLGSLDGGNVLLNHYPDERSEERKKQRYLYALEKRKYEPAIHRHSGRGQ